MKRICIEMKNGRRMTADLYDEVAPKTVAHFLDLIRDNFFDNLIFHRIIDGFMVQGGAYYVDDRTLRERASQTISGEFEANGTVNNLAHKLGVLSMARTNDFNSASSQFFICLGDCEPLDKQYAAFGRLVDVESIDTLLHIARVPKGKLNDMFEDFPARIDDDVTIKTIREM